MKTNNKSVIVYCHPYDKSFSSAIKSSAEKALITKGKEVTVINLAKDDYNPMNANKKTATHAKLVKSYKEIIKAASEVVFTYPIWWSGQPAQLKGFIDEIFSEKDFYKIDNGAITPNGKMPSKFYVFTTSFTPNIVIKTLLLSSSKRALKSTLKTKGAKKVTFKNLDKVGASAYRREKYLKNVGKLLKKGGFNG